MSTKLQGNAAVLKGKAAAMSITAKNDPAEIEKVAKAVTTAIEAANAAKKVLANTVDTTARQQQQLVVDQAVHAAEDAMATHLAVQQLLGQATVAADLIATELRLAGVDCDSEDKPASNVAARLTATVTGKRNWFTQTF
ncbi:MAG: hypothetical protein WCT04_07590 [Planctomycetota bacterium]